MGWIWGGWVTLWAQFPGLGLDLEVPVLFNVWQPQGTAWVLLLKTTGKTPACHCQQKSPGVQARLSGIFHLPPAQGSHGMEGARGLGHVVPLFRVAEMLPDGGGWERESRAENAPFGPSSVMLGGSWIP